MKRWWNNLLYWLVYGAWRALSLLPLWLHYAFSSCLSVLLDHVVRYRRRVVWKNLRESFPEWDERRTRQVMHEFYRHMCDMLVETVKYPGMSQRTLRRRMRFTNPEVVYDILGSGQDIAFCLGHYGNWEWVTSMVMWMPPMPGVAYGQIYHPLENPVLDRVVLTMRERRGSACVSKKETLRWLLSHRREGHTTMLGYINDQVPLWWNIHHWLDFLHHDTPVFTGMERIARKQRQAVVYLDVTRVSRGHYECTFQVMTRDPGELSPFAVTDDYFRRLETTIRRQPPYWLWSHNRWKRTHEEFDARYEVVDGRVVEKGEKK